MGTYELLPIHVYALHPRPILIVVGDPHPHDRPNLARRRRSHPAHLRVHLRDLRAVHPEPLAWVSLGALPFLHKCSTWNIEDVISSKEHEAPHRHPRPRPALTSPTTSAPGLNMLSRSAQRRRARRDPPRRNPTAIANLINTCQAVLLPGSPADVNPQKYGQNPIPECAPADKPRENVDELLLQTPTTSTSPSSPSASASSSSTSGAAGTLVQDPDHPPREPRCRKLGRHRPHRRSRSRLPPRHPPHPFRGPRAGRFPPPRRQLQPSSGDRHSRRRPPHLSPLPPGRSYRGHRRRPGYRRRVRTLRIGESNGIPNAATTSVLPRGPYSIASIAEAVIWTPRPIHTSVA